MKVTKESKLIVFLRLLDSQKSRIFEIHNALQLLLQLINPIQH